MKKLAALLTLFILAFGFACGDDDDGSGGSGSAGDASVMDGASGVGGTSGTDASGEGGSGGTAGIEPMDAALDGNVEQGPTLQDLEGTWVGPCFEDGGDYRIMSLVFSGTTMTLQMGFFGATDTTCQQEALRFELTMSLTPAVAPSGIPGASTFQMTITAVTATLPSAESADGANAAGLFGYTDWEANVPRDVAGREFQPADEDAGAGNAVPGLGPVGPMSFRLNDAGDELQTSEFGGAGSTLGPDVFRKQ